MPKITHVWVVTKPSKYSEMEDICFEMELEMLHRQFIGGLKPEDVVGFYTDEKSARAEAATQLIKQVEA